MSFGDPNDNPYSAPPPQPPGQGVPPPPPNQPGYGHPQAPPNQPGYGYPQAPQAPPGYGGYPQQPAYPGYPGTNMMHQSMPGLLVTARVFLFIVAAVQVLGALGYIYVAAFIKDIADNADDYGLTTFGDDVDTFTTVAAIAAVVFAALATLSITLGVKFGTGGQGVRITTVIYGALGTIVGIIGLFTAIDTNMASVAIFPVLWVIFGGIITAAPVVPSGTAWFSRPRY